MSTVTPLTPAQTALQEAKAAKEGYFRKLPVAVDIFASELAGNPMGMTISTSWGLLALGVNPHDTTKRVGKFWQVLGKAGCKTLDLFQSNHDAKTAAGDDARAAHLRQLLQVSGIISPSPSPSETSTLSPVPCSESTSQQTPQPPATVSCPSETAPDSAPQ